MGYMIQYNPEQNNKYPSLVTAPRKKGWRIVLAILVIGVFLSVAVRYRDYFIRCFLPGDGKVATIALEELIQNYKSGIPLSEAVTTFCREIIASAA